MEVEKKSLRFKPPISFVPLEHELTSLMSEKEHFVKIKLAHHVEESIPVFNNGVTPEDYLTHLQNFDNLVDKKELGSTLAGWRRKNYPCLKIYN